MNKNFCNDISQKKSYHNFVMALVLYNTFTKSEEEFHPRKKGEVTMYTCGPTVYGRPHIGNYSSFLMADMLRRWLEIGHNSKVIQVKNITDVGHLVADADDGVDKVEKQAKEEFGEVTHESVIGIARKYEQQYLEDEAALNMLEPAHRSRATDYIEQMKEMIDSLLQSGHAYVLEDGIYFDVSSDMPTPYGSLSGNKLDDLKAGSRVEVHQDKKHPADFALWKFCVGQNENHALRWPSPSGLAPYPSEASGMGFPGWHIECSAMSRSLLGDQIDIHTGGEDNIFPHHECEIAQSECVTGKKPFVSLWLHKRRIDLGTEKMSKSLGNVLTVPDIVEMGFSPLDLRYYFLSVHYRTQLKFAEKGLEDAHKARRRIMEWMDTVDSSSDETQRTEEKEKFADAMNADLNTPGALAVVFDAITASHKEGNAGAYKEFVNVVRHTFGCFDPEKESIPLEIEKLLDQRTAARAAKDFEASDRLRDEIRDLGYEVRDVDGDQVVKKM